jgi:hypothetical protein
MNSITLPDSDSTLESCHSEVIVADSCESTGNSMSGLTSSSYHFPSINGDPSINLGTPNAVAEFQIKTNDCTKVSGVKYDIVIGSDLVYCKSDPCGILEVLSAYLSNSGIFVIVIPEPSHRYGTEYLVPTLQNGGFEVYYRSVAHTNCTSCEVTQIIDGNTVGDISKKIWTSAGLRSDQTQYDSQNEHRLKLFALVDSLIIDDDFLVADLDEEEFVAWQLVIGHKRRK